MTNANESVVAYIKATTSFGGVDYDDFADGYTDENTDEFEAWIAHAPKVSGRTLYRGYTFDRGYWEDGYVEPGAIIDENSMTAELDLPAFTASPLRATLYMNDYGNGLGLDDCVRVLFEIKTSGHYFTDVSEFSYYPSEGECRCMRGTRLLVKSITRKGGYLHVICEESL